MIFEVGYHVDILRQTPKSRNLRAIPHPPMVGRLTIPVPPLLQGPQAFSGRRLIGAPSAPQAEASKSLQQAAPISQPDQDGRRIRQPGHSGWARGQRVSNACLYTRAQQSTPDRNNSSSTSRLIPCFSRGDAVFGSLCLSLMVWGNSLGGGFGWRFRGVGGLLLGRLCESSCARPKSGMAPSSGGRSPSSAASAANPSTDAADNGHSISTQDRLTGSPALRHLDAHELPV